MTAPIELLQQVSDEQYLADQAKLARAERAEAEKGPSFLAWPPGKRILEGLQHLTSMPDLNFAYKVNYGEPEQEELEIEATVSGRKLPSIEVYGNDDDIRCGSTAAQTATGLYHPPLLKFERKGDTAPPRQSFARWPSTLCG